jgi:hypothetical protein
MSSVTFSTTVGGDGSTVTDDDDATTGLRNGGWRTRFVPALTQEVAVAANAVASATAALSSKNAAAASASNAAASASNAAASASNAVSSATAAAASYDSFDDRYLGAKTSDPTVDNDGNALLTGALYWNSATGVFKVWSGSAWITNITSNQFGTNVATFLQTPTSANLAAALTDETGTGANVFASNPTFPAQINLTANSGYNIYASGTADNYLAGNLGVGGIPVSSITALGAGQSTASFNTSTGLGGALIVGDTSSAGGNGGAIVFSAASTAWRFAAIKGMATNGSSNSQGDLVFSVRPVATDSTLTESFRLLASKNATFAGSVGIGTAVSAGTNLIVNKNSTGATTTYSVDNQFTIQSDVTTLATGFRSVALTQAASFTLANLVHFDTTQIAFGAGSNVTNQYGYIASGSLTGATNNYGFYGGIASGTGRYNLHIAGTADNYLAGNLSVGTVNKLGTITNYGALGMICASGDSTVNRSLKFYIDGTLYGGIYSPNGKSLAFQVGASTLSDAMVIDQSSNVGIGTASPDASAILDVQSTTKGVRMPNMTTTQKNAIASPAAGLMVFDTNLAKLCVYSGAAWQTITSV